MIFSFKYALHLFINLLNQNSSFDPGNRTILDGLVIHVFVGTGGGEILGEVLPSEPSQAPGVLLGRQGVPSCLRIYAKGKLGKPPFQK